MLYCSQLIFFKNQLFRKMLSGIPPECQTDWILIGFEFCLVSGTIFGGDIERFAHFPNTNLIEIGFMGEKLIVKCNLAKILLKFLAENS